MVYVSGFVGTNSYDLIHYLSRVSRALKKRCLLIDCSDNLALSYTIRNPIVPAGSIVDYRGVDFIGHPSSLSLVDSYDYVFIDFGFSLDDEFIDECDGIFVVTDHQLQNVMQLKDLELDPEQDLALVVRDSVGSKFNTNSIRGMLGDLKFDDDSVFEIEMSDYNTAAALSVQYDSVFKFDKTTASIKDFVIDFYKIDFKESDVKSAFKKASKAK